jgi:hypothetical protein
MDMAGGLRLLAGSIYGDTSLPELNVQLQPQ